MVFCEFIRVCVGVGGWWWWHLSITDSNAVKARQEKKEWRGEKLVEKQKWRGCCWDKETQDGEQKKNNEWDGKKAELRKKIKEELL